MTKTAAIPAAAWFETIRHWNFGFVSDFGFRISDLHFPPLVFGAPSSPAATLIARGMVRVHGLHVSQPKLRRRLGGLALRLPKTRAQAQYQQHGDIRISQRRAAECRFDPLQEQRQGIHGGWRSRPLDPLAHLLLETRRQWRRYRPFAQDGVERFVVAGGRIGFHSLTLAAV